MPILARYKFFKSSFHSWEKMAEEVTAFLTTLGPGRVISVSHSQESSHGVIAVWYWEVTEENQPSDSTEPT
jgi:hypothetical protein